MPNAVKGAVTLLCVATDPTSQPVVIASPAGRKDRSASSIHHAAARPGTDRVIVAKKRHEGRSVSRIRAELGREGDTSPHHPRKAVTVSMVSACSGDLSSR